MDEHKHYPIDSAGRAVESNVPIVNADISVDSARSHVLAGMSRFETINYVYVTDAGGNLVGVLSIKELFRADKAKKISEIMKKDVIRVHPYSDQERAVVLSLRRSIKAVPVVDHDGKFLGVIPSDRVLSILHSEHIEDLLHVVGVQKSLHEVQSLGTESAYELFRRRIPWLLIGLIAGFLSAWLIRSFQFILEQELLLAAFIPAIVYLSDAVGNQTQVLFIRNLTFQELFKMSSYAWREVRIGALTAATLAVIFSAIGGAISGSREIAATLGITLVFSILAAMGVAMFVPWLLLKFNQDPALASGPFSTALRDISSLFIYFTVASLVLKSLS